MEHPARTAYRAQLVLLVTKAHRDHKVIRATLVHRVHKVTKGHKGLLVQWGRPVHKARLVLKG